MKHPDWVTVSEGAELVKRPAVTVRYWAAHKLVNARRSKGTWLIWRSSLEKLALYRRPKDAKK